jgi:transcriptional regulator with XRE-family HTH domain
MPKSFSARLRQRREQQQISLSTIAEQTKIKLSLLEALERGDVTHWPSGIFRRAFIRAYAHAIGLEPNVVVREFLEIYPDPTELVEPMPPIAAVIDGPSGAPPTRLRYLVASAVGSLARRRARTVPEPGDISQPVPAERPPVTPSATPQQPPAAQVEPPAAQAASSDPQIEARASQVEPPAPQPVAEPVDLPAIAELCTQLGRASSPVQLAPLLQEAARVLDASGLVVWIWDPMSAELHPALAHGYSDRVLAQLPGLPRDANNATAAAFREAQMCVVPGDDAINGALVLPLMTPTGCTGVLALELHKRSEERESIRAAGTIVAAQLAALIGIGVTADNAEPVRSTG